MERDRPRWHEDPGRIGPGVSMAGSTTHARLRRIAALIAAAGALWPLTARSRPPSSLLIARQGTIQGDISLTAQPSLDAPFVGLTVTPHLAVARAELALAPDIAVRTGIGEDRDIGLRLGSSGAQVSSRMLVTRFGKYALATEPWLLISQRTFRHVSEFGFLEWAGCTYAEAGAPLWFAGDLTEDLGFHAGPTLSVRQQIDCGDHTPITVGASAALGLRVIPGFQLAIGATLGTDLNAPARRGPGDQPFAIAQLTFSTAAEIRR
jgi:hypothetical protein